MADREYTAIDLARASVAPRNCQCLPPSTSTLSSFSKRLDYTGNFHVDDSALINELVPTSSGAVLWFPSHGAGSVYRFGIVAAGTLATSPGSFLYTGPLPTFTYNSPTALPYGNQVTSDIITIAPPLTSNLFSRVRVVAGDCRMSCDSIPIGNTALNGVFSASAFNDIRDVFQTGYITGVTSGTTLDPSQLVQTACTQKDGIKEVSGMNGVRVLVGPDISPTYGPPDADGPAADCVYGGPPLSVFTGVGANLVAPGSEPTLVAGAQVTQASYWISPWNTTYADAWSPAFTPVNINYGPIDPFSVLDIHFACQYQHQTSQTAGYAESWYLFVEHVFATVSSTGAVVYNHWPDYYVMAQLNSYQSNSESYVVDITPKPYQGPMNGSNPTGVLPILPGIYLGTQLNVNTSNLTSVNGTGPCGFLYEVNITVRSRNQYAPGALGPVRCIQYDSFSNKQNLRFDGVVFAECIPGGTSAPFTQLAAQTSEKCINLSALPFLSELYNGEGPFKRVWTVTDHDEFIRVSLLRFRADTLGDYSSFRAYVAAKHAGLVEDVEEDTQEEYEYNEKRRRGHW